MHRSRQMLAAAAVLVAVLVLVATAAGNPGLQRSEKLRAAVTLEGVRAHQAALQAIADANDGTRASGTSGYDASVAYVVARMQAAGYQVSTQTFDFGYFEELADPELEQISPNPKTYAVGDDFLTMEFSPTGETTASVQAVDTTLTPSDTGTSGCEAADFAGFVAGRIALIQRGTCTYELKSQNAQAAGATGVVIFNRGTPGFTDAVNGTLGQPGVGIPVVGASWDTGTDLFSTNAGVVAHLKTSTISELRPTQNVFAETKKGRDDFVVMVGAHLDSVTAGPGINDNGSGTATILEIAEQLAGKKTKNKIRFAWWGAEEPGLLGSINYVDNLSDEELADIALYLNFDMVGSPNFVRFVYDGDGSAGESDPGPPGSDEIEQVFLEYFAALGLPNEPTAFDGRSDYGPFIDVGIPAGGLFTGAEEIKTAEQAATYGGTAGTPLDPCYHEACDTYDNNSDTALDEMADATAHAVDWWASSKNIAGSGNKKNKDALNATATRTAFSQASGIDVR
jgi:Zn-dependent M28 family amino/carboxypeptidase